MDGGCLVNVYGWIFVTIILFLLAAQTWYYIERIWDLRQQFAKDMAAKDKLYREQTKIMKEVRVEDVLGRTEQM